MGHQCKVALSIIKGESSECAFGFVDGKTITCDIKPDESSAVTAVRLAQEYIDTDLDWIDIVKVNFYVDSVHPMVVDAKTGNAVGEDIYYTYLLYRARVGGSIKTSPKINWIRVSNTEKLKQIPLIKLHLDSLML